MNKNTQIRTYNKKDCIIFCKTKEKWGELSNMCSGFPIKIGSIKIKTSEALYQACRFPNDSEIQRKILEENSPISAKNIAKENILKTRNDWESFHIQTMRFCLRQKLINNLEKFGNILKETGDKPIVELSYKSDYWGAKPINKTELQGYNILGRLLMELRSIMYDKKLLFYTPKINNFLLMRKDIKSILDTNRKLTDIIEHNQELIIEKIINNPLIYKEIFKVIIDDMLDELFITGKEAREKLHKLIINSELTDFKSIEELIDKLNFFYINHLKNIPIAY